jgi:hypothetical protein
MPYPQLPIRDQRGDGAAGITIQDEGYRRVEIEPLSEYFEI